MYRATDECWSYFNFEIVEATFNVSADIIVLLIAIPLLLGLHLPIQQKAVIVGVFGMGIFVIAAALLTKVFSLDPNLVSYAYLNWYFREASVSIYVTNLPGVWALLRDIFPAVKAWGYKPWTDDRASPASRQWSSSHRGAGSKNDLPFIESWAQSNNSNFEESESGRHHSPARSEERIFTPNS
jgi:hypothetical protein